MNRHLFSFPFVVVCWVWVWCLSVALPLHGQIYEQIYTSTGTGRKPSAGLTLTPQGDFLGVTENGGGTDRGTIFRVTRAGTLTTVVNFNGKNGAFPDGPLRLASDGNYYGTTSGGGASNAGTVYRLSPSGTLTTLASFTATIGSGPVGRLYQHTDGALYGAAKYGGTNSAGTIFKITLAGVLTKVVDFNYTNGDLPRGSLVRGADGRLYGVTQFGGNDDKGAAFALALTPSVSLTKLGDFTNTTGAYPGGGLTLGTDGFFYGVALETDGQSFGGGALYRLGTTVGSLSRRFTFGATVGSRPAGELLLAPDGSFYSVASEFTLGGTDTEGSVINLRQVAGTWTGTTVAVFNNDNGRNPVYGLTLGTDGALYGTTPEGGVNDYTYFDPERGFDIHVIGGGVCFRVALGATPSISQIAEFFSDGDGRFVSPLTPHTDGKFYGITNDNFFRVGPTGNFERLASLPGPASRGEVTFSGNTPFVTIETSGGFISETTVGAIYRFNGTTFDLVVKFSGSADGAAIPNGLALGADGNLYGTTLLGGPADAGTVFSITPAGVFRSVGSFPGGTGGDGPKGRLLRWTDNNFYATTRNGGSAGFGAICNIVPPSTPTGSATITTLRSLTVTANGVSPDAGLILGADGNFWASASIGGTLYDPDEDIFGDGTIFRVGPSGASAPVRVTAFSGTNGSNPNQLALLGSDYYGTTEEGGANDAGTIFRIAGGSTFSTIYQFGNDPASEGAPTNLIRGADGNLYGTVASNIYRLLFPGAPLASTEPAQSITDAGALAFARVNARGLSTTIKIEYGTDGVNFPNSVDTTPAVLTDALTTTVFAPVPVGSEAATRHYRVRATNSSGTTVGDVVSFTTLALPVAVSTPPTGIATTSATLKGTVNARGSTATAFFEYGTDGNTFPLRQNATPSSVPGSGVVQVSADVAGLARGLTYFYRLVAANGAGTVTSGVQSFITLTDPVVTTGGSTVLDATSATVSGTVDARGANTAVVFEYATNADFSTGVLSTPAAPSQVTGTSPVPVSAMLTGLAPGVTYHYRVAATSAGGSATSAPAGMFPTPQLPELAAAEASAVGVGGATLNGTADANGLSTAVVFEYGTDGVNFPNSVSATPGTVTGSTATTVSATIGGLSAGTTYRYRVRGTSSAGTAVSATVEPFVTLVAPTATTTGSSEVAAAWAAVSGMVNANNASTSVIFEYGTDGVSFPLSVTASPSPVAGVGDTVVSAVLTGLAEDTTYHFRVRATSAAGSATGAVRTLRTLRFPLVTIEPVGGASIAGAMLSATVSARGSATVVSVELATDFAFSNAATLPTLPSPVLAAETRLVNATTASLQSGTIYYYRFRAVSAAGTVVSDAATFTTPNPPVVALGAPTNVTATRAQLNGTVNALGASATIRFELANNLAFTNPTTLVASPSLVSGTDLVAVSAVATGLQDGATYYYRLKASSDGGDTTTPGFETVATLALPTGETLAITAAGTSSATLPATVNARGMSAAVLFDYGTDSANFTNTVAANPAMVTGAADTSVSATIAGLTPDTVYFFRVRAVNQAGPFTGQTKNFRTAQSVTMRTIAPDPQPSAREVGITDGLLKGAINTSGQSTAVSFVWGTDGVTFPHEIAAEPSTVNASGEVPVSKRLPNLDPGQTYYFRLRAINADGISMSQDQAQFTTVTNATPVAQDDYFFYSGQAVFNPLENDSDPNDLDANGQPSNANLTIIATALAALPPRTTTYLDKVKFVAGGKLMTYNAGDAQPEDEYFRYQVRDSQETVATAQVHLIHFRTRSGLYTTGFEVPTAPASRSDSISFQLGLSGVGTGRLFWEGARYPLSGNFDEHGIFLRTPDKDGDSTRQISVQLALPEIVGAQKTMRARIEEIVKATGAVVLSAEFDVPLDAASSVRPGLLNGFLTSINSSPGEPEGFLSLNIANRPTRPARLIGRLPDARLFSAPLSVKRFTYEVNSPMGKKGRDGVLKGAINILQNKSDNNPAGMAGTLTFTAADGSETVLNLDGAQWRAPLRGMPAPLSVTSNATQYNITLRLGGGGLPGAVDAGFVVTARGAQLIGVTPVVPGAAIPNQTKLKLNAKTGVFTGSFIAPGARAKTPFNGALVPAFADDPGEGRGVFGSPISTGRVSLIVP